MRVGFLLAHAARACSGSVLDFCQRAAARQTNKARHERNIDEESRSTYSLACRPGCCRRVCAAQSTASAVPSNAQPAEHRNVRQHRCADGFDSDCMYSFIHSLRGEFPVLKNTQQATWTCHTCLNGEREMGCRREQARSQIACPHASAAPGFKSRLASERNASTATSTHHPMRRSVEPIWS